MFTLNFTRKVLGVEGWGYYTGGVECAWKKTKGK